MAHHGLTNYAEIQQNEIDALKSIFMEDFEEEKAKAAAWNKTADRKFRLKLWPMSGNTDHTEHVELFAMLFVSLPTAYPKQIPQCHLDFGTSVPQKIQATIRRLVPEKAKTLIGNEAIYEIAELIQEQLDAALAALAHTQSLPALDEERVKRQVQTDLEAETARKAHLKAVQQAQQQEDDARSAAIGKELHAQKTTSRTMNIPANTPLPDPGVSIHFDAEMRARTLLGTIVAFRTVRLPTPFERGPVTEVGLTAPADLHLGADVPTLILKSCKVGVGWDENELKAELSHTLEVDLEALVNLPSHQNVLPVLGFRIQETEPEARSRTWTVNVLNEYVRRGNLKDFVDMVGKLPVNTFSTIINQILAGLGHLHQNRIPHGRLTLENILLHRLPTGGMEVKLTDMLFQSEMHFLKRPGEAALSAAPSTYWQPPEFAQSHTIRSTTSGDIWQLGVVILQMLLGVDIQSQHSAPLQVKDALPLHPRFEALLERIFKANPQRRPICMQLMSHDFIREPPSTFEEKEDSTLLSRVPSESAAFTPKAMRARLGSQGQVSGSREHQTSRYADDFTQLSRLGKGGFGEVFRARNKLDGQTYAVKTIVSESTEDLQGVLGEVMLLSRLYHPNIVRYVTAWIEKSRLGQPSMVLSDEGSGFQDSLNDRGSNLLSLSRQSRSRGLDFISSNAGIDTDEESDEDESSTEGEPDSDDNEKPEDSTDTSRAVVVTSGLDDENDDHHNDGDDDDYDDYYYDDNVDDTNFVEFTNDTDDGKKISEKPKTSTPKRAPKAAPQRDRRRSSAAAEVPTKITLYIQMEFCENQTLRDVIKSDISKSPDEYWRFLRQVTDALAYVHSNNIIHRDLKPENIFVSGSSIRLGDFGLAKPQSKQRVIERPVGPSDALTQSVGTSTYIAPEVHSSGGGTYDEKVDMYSLGMILFEMCWSSKTTAMERAAVIRDLHQDPPLLPDSFDQSKVLEKDLVSQLLSHRPDGRPSANDLLQKIPTEANDEVLNQRINDALADERDPLHRVILRQVFNRSSDSKETAKHYMYDAVLNQHYIAPDNAYLLSLVKDQLIHVFRRHCAVESTRQSFIPNTDHWTDTVKVMDETGQLLHLPYDLTLPGARLLAKSGKEIAPCKSYSIGPVYRRSDRPSQHPITSIEIDFDIVSNSSLDPGLREAETIKVIDEIIDAVPALTAREMCFHISHCDLLDAILRTCKVPSEKWRHVKDVISRLGHKPFSQIRTELRGSDAAIPSTAVDDLARFDFREEPKAAIKRLRRLFGKIDNLDSTFGHILGVVNFAKRMRVQRKIWIAPLACHSAHFYDGSLMFQCLFDSRKNRQVMCAGGRYDRLIRELASNRSVSPCFAVGFQLSWRKLTDALQKHNEKSGKIKEDASTTIRRGDVLVASNDEALLREEGIAVLEELWANDIRAELSIDAEDIEVSTYRGESSHDWIIHVKQENNLRVRSMISNSEEEIHRSELVTYIRGKIRERDQGRRTWDRSRTSHHVGSNEGSNDYRNHAAKVHVLSAGTRSKKSNRQAIVSEAQHYTSELTQNLRNGPIAAVELKDELFEMMRGVRIDDADGWRKVIQSADLNARQYMGQVHELLLGWARDAQGPRNAYLYNFRSKACMLYDLTRSS